MGAKNLIYTEKKIHFKEGDIIFKENDEGAKEMYFIDSGRVKIVKKVGDANATLATIEEIIEQDWHIVKLSQTDISKVNYEQYIVENLPKIERIGSGLNRANTQSPINRLKLQLHKWFSGKAPLLE
jgi:hypothetical protein